MKHFYCLTLAALLLPGVAWAQQPSDSTRLQRLSEAVVKSVKAQKNAPYAVTNISKAQLEKFATTNQELPFLLSRTPGVVAWSENGVGTGTTYMRIRGAADSRINVTLDGVPLNSPEDQCVFWANMNSYASLLGNVQVQRGVGTSTNGDGAFGGSIMLQTRTPQTRPSFEMTSSYGSYNTWRAGARFSSGLLWKHLILDGAYHHSGTDGYIHGTDGNSGSYYAGLTYINTGGNLKLSYKNIGNYEHTGQAWNGIDTGELFDSNYGGMGTGITTYKDMCDAGLGRYNTLYETLVDPYDPSKGTMRYRTAGGGFWPRTTDNFWQNHNLLNLAWTINQHWSTTATAHYTRGSGYYEEFRYNNKLSKFGLANMTDGEGNTIKKTDFVRQKGLTQDAYGLVASANYQDDRWDVIMGGAVQNFNGNHYGYLTYAAHPVVQNFLLASPAQIGGADAALKYRYYDSDARKFDANVYAKATYHILPCLDALMDVQYRHVGYKTDGINDKFLANTDGTYANQRLDINKTYNFLNPKVGLTYHQGPHTLFGSWAMSNREPERNNFTDNGNYPAPKAERLSDLELGYNHRATRWNLGVNAYWMNYHDQFVKTGLKSDIGEDLTTNIQRSYRLGLELTAAYAPTDWLTIEANAALSHNRILDFDEVVEDWDNGSATVHYDNSTLAFSPACILNGFLDFHWRGLSAVWHTAYVSRQYMDNTACIQRSLEGYTASDLQLSYDLRVGNTGLRNIVFGVNLNNVFNSRHALSGWVYSAVYASGGNPEGNRYTELGFIPCNPFMAMGSITLKF